MMPCARLPRTFSQGEARQEDDIIQYARYRRPSSSSAIEGPSRDDAADDKHQTCFFPISSANDARLCTVFLSPQSLTRQTLLQ